MNPHRRLTSSHVCYVLSPQGIEQLKKEERRWAKKSKWMNLKVVFGHPFSIHWLSPFATPDHGKADVYQYIVWKLDTQLSSAAVDLDWSIPVWPPIGWTAMSMNSSSPLLHFLSFIDISGCSAVSYYIINICLFLKHFHFYCFPLDADWD